MNDSGPIYVTGTKLSLMVKLIFYGLAVVLLTIAATLIAFEVEGAEGMVAVGVIIPLIPHLVFASRYEIWSDHYRMIRGHWLSPIKLFSSRLKFQDVNEFKYGETVDKMFYAMVNAPGPGLPILIVGAGGWLAITPENPDEFIAVFNQALEAYREKHPEGSQAE